MTYVVLIAVFDNCVCDIQDLFFWIEESLVVGEHLPEEIDTADIILCVDVEFLDVKTPLKIDLIV